MRIGSHSASAGTRHDDGRFLPWRVHLHGDRCAALGGAAEQRSAGSFRWDFLCWSVLLNHCARPEVPDSDDGHYQRQHDHRQHRRHGERHVKGGRAIACCRACMPPRTSCEFYLGIDGYISGAIYGAPSRPSPHPTYSIERVRSGRIVGCSAPFARCTEPWSAPRVTNSP